MGCRAEISASPVGEQVQQNLFPYVLHASALGFTVIVEMDKARGKIGLRGGGGVVGAPRRRGGGSGNGAPVTEPLVKYQSPRTEVARSSTGAGVVYPPFWGSFA